MQQSTSQLPLATRIPALVESIKATKAMKEQYTREEATLMDELAQAEAEVTGKAPGSEGVELSGLIPEGENPYAATPAAEPEPEDAPKKRR